MNPNLRAAIPKQGGGPSDIQKSELSASPPLPAMHRRHARCKRGALKRWQRRLFVADERLKKGFVTHIQAVHRLTADIHLRGFLHVHSTRVAQMALPSSIDMQVLEHTNASELQRQARLAAQRRRVYVCEKQKSGKEGGGGVLV